MRPTLRITTTIVSSIIPILLTQRYTYDADGNRIKEVSGNITTYDFFPMYQEERATNPVETVWVEDALPAGAVPASSGGDSWNWVTSPKYSGSKAHASANVTGIHQHYFTNATQPLVVGANDMLFTWVYLDPASPPRQVMLQWYDGSWEHRAYWGENLITWGTNGTDSRRSMGPLPAAGGWVRLEVPAGAVGLAGHTVTGMAFSLYDGKATWDRAGKFTRTTVPTKYYSFNGMTIAMKEGSTLRYLHGDHLGSTSKTTNSSGAEIASRTYYAYGTTRSTSGNLQTDRTFTGQKADETGLMFFEARYFDPALGTFVSPDTIVPEPGVVFDYNRYMYVRGNSLKYNDPSGHVGVCFQGSPATEVGDEGPLGALCSELGTGGLLGEGYKGKFYNVFANDANGKQKAWEWIQSVRSEKPDEPISLIGYSWGGSAALEFADFLGKQNVTVDAMVLVDPVVRLLPPGRTATGSTSPSLGESLSRYFSPAAPGNVSRTLNAYAPEEEKFSFLEGRENIRGAENVPISGSHHASIMDANQPRWGLSSSFGYSSNTIFSRGETLNPLTLDVVKTWIRTGSVP